MDLTLDRRLRVGKRLAPLWLHGRVGGRDALEFRVEGLEWPGTLEALYDRVELAPATGSPPALPFDAGAFDLVCAYGFAPDARMAAEIRRVLRPGGMALVAARQRWWYGRLRPGASKHAGAMAGPELAARLRRAGFAAVHAYHVAPSLAEPRIVVPYHGVRVATLPALQRGVGWRDSLRGLVARAGLHAVLMPAMVLVAEVGDAGDVSDGDGR